MARYTTHPDATRCAIYWLRPRRSPSLTLTCPSRSTSNSVDSQSLRPTSYMRPHSAHLMSPSSDIVGPSPVTSNGTETTEIEDDALSDAGDQAVPAETGSTPQVRTSGDAALDAFWLTPTQLKSLKTNVPDSVRTTSSEEAVSVIHAPESFQQWVR